MAAARLVRRFAWVARSEARCLAPANVGRAIAMRSPMISTTTISSMRVKPASLLREVLIRSVFPSLLWVRTGGGSLSGRPPLALFVVRVLSLPGAVARSERHGLGPGAGVRRL